MQILTSLLSRARSLDAALRDGSLLGAVLPNHPDEIMAYQRQQLFEGKGSDGEDLRPYYSEDIQPAGYFRSVETAEAYAVYKQRIHYPYSAMERNPDAPNLYINGKFHSELGVFFGSDEVMVAGSTAYADGIVEKYGLGRFGLQADYWNELLRKILPEIMCNVEEIIYD